MRRSIIAYLASASLVSAFPPNQNGISEREELPEAFRVAARQELAVGSTWKFPSWCTATSENGGFRDLYTQLVPTRSAVFTTIGLASATPSPAFDALSFCSQVVQSVSIAYAQTTASGVKTDTRVTTTTTASSATITDNSPGTTTVLCPTPSTSMTCNLQKANGYSPHLLDFKDSTSGPECQQWCLKTPGCKSFQIVPQNSDIGHYDRCNLWDMATAGNVDVGQNWYTGTFFDRDCGNFLPSGCSNGRSAQITTAPSLSVAVAARADGIQKREYSIPSFITSAQLIFLPLVCSCLITAAPAPLTSTVTNLVQTWEIVTVTSTNRQYYPTTVHPEWRTVYTSTV